MPCVFSYSDRKLPSFSNDIAESRRTLMDSGGFDHFSETARFMLNAVTPPRPGLPGTGTEITLPCTRRFRSGSYGLGSCPSTAIDPRRGSLTCSGPCAPRVP